MGGSPLRLQVFPAHYEDVLLSADRIDRRMDTSNTGDDVLLPEDNIVRRMSTSTTGNVEGEIFLCCLWKRETLRNIIQIDLF